MLASWRFLTALFSAGVVAVRAPPTDLTLRTTEQLVVNLAASSAALAASSPNNNSASPPPPSLYQNVAVHEVCLGSGGVGRCVDT